MKLEETAAHHVVDLVPQTVMCGPVLYVLYTAELSEVITHHGLNVHQYADDT